jgi:hypothetical protein
VAAVVGAVDRRTGQTAVGVNITGKSGDVCAEDLCRIDLVALG